jgi:hypothetical protein
MTMLERFVANSGFSLEWIRVFERGRFGFASALAYGSEVFAFGDGFISGTKVPGFCLEALCASLWFGICS